MLGNFFVSGSFAQRYDFKSSLLQFQIFNFSILSTEWIFQNVFIQSTRLFGEWPSLAVTNSTALNIILHVSLGELTYVHISASIHPEVELLAIDFVYVILEKMLPVFKSGFINLHSYLWCRVQFTFLPTLGIISLLPLILGVV